jgi:hypothetical protein
MFKTSSIGGNVSRCCKKAFSASRISQFARCFTARRSRVAKTGRPDFEIGQSHFDFRFDLGVGQTRVHQTQGFDIARNFGRDPRPSAWLDGGRWRHIGMNGIGLAVPDDHVRLKWIDDQELTLQKFRFQFLSAVSLL